MTTKSMNQELLNALLELREKVHKAQADKDYFPTTFEAGSGICCNIPKELRSQLDIMRKWPKYSGEYAYPVPRSMGDDYRNSAADAYWFSNTENMWFTGEYAELRMELLNWMIKELENDNA